MGKLSLLILAVVYIYQVNANAIAVRQKDFESNENLIRASRQISNQSKRIICYYGTWAIYRDGPNKFNPEDIDPSLCTHILYGYAKPDREEGVIPGNDNFDLEQKGWERFIALKKINPDVKLILSVGGLLEGSARFSRIALDGKTRQIFARSAASVMRTGFDGLDMSWLYPAFSEGSSSSDKENYVQLLKDIREEFGNDYILSITIPGLQGLLRTGYDLPEINKYVDFFNVWAGAYHDSTSPAVNHPSPLYPASNSPADRDSNVDATIQYCLKQGVPPQKMNLLVALYGLYFVLEDPSNTDLGAPTSDEAENNEWRGGLVYNELCQKIRKENWTVKRVNMNVMGPYAYKDNQWVAYDDETIIRNKARYAVQMNLGGFGFWTVDQDDFKGSCHLISYPLVRAGREVMLSNPSNAVSPVDGFLPLTTTPFFNQPNPINPSYPTVMPQPDPPLVPPSFFSGSPSNQIPGTKNDRELRPTFTDPNDLFIEGPETGFNNDISGQGVVNRKGTTIYQSNRDMIFQTVRVWIMNNFFNHKPT